MSKLGGCNLLMVFLIFLSLFLESSSAVAAAARSREEEEDDDDDIMNSLYSASMEMENIAGYGERKLSTVLVTGTLLCEKQLADSVNCVGHEKHQHADPQPVSGATVAVACHPGRKTKRSNWVRSTTDEYGDFAIDLPSHLHGIPNLEKICLVKVLQLPRSSQCNPSFTGKQKGITLSSIDDGLREYTAETIHMRPRTHACKNTGGRRTKMVQAN